MLKSWLLLFSIRNIYNPQGIYSVQDFVKTLLLKMHSLLTDQGTNRLLIFVLRKGIIEITEEFSLQSSNNAFTFIPENVQAVGS